MEYLSSSKKEALIDIFVVWDEYGHIPKTAEEFNKSKTVRRVADIPPAGRVSIAFGRYENSLSYAEKYYRNEEARKEIDPDYERKKKRAAAAATATTTAPPTEEEAPAPAKEVLAPAEETTPAPRRKGTRRSKSYRQSVEESLKTMDTEKETAKTESVTPPQKPLDEPKKPTPASEPAEEAKEPLEQPEECEEPIIIDSSDDAEEYYEYEEYEDGEEINVEELNNDTSDADEINSNESDNESIDEAPIESQEPQTQSVEESVQQPEESQPTEVEALQPEESKPEPGKPRPEPKVAAMQPQEVETPKPVKKEVRNMEDNKIILNATDKTIYLVDYGSATADNPPHVAASLAVQKTGRAIALKAAVTVDNIGHTPVKATFGRPAMIRNNGCSDFPEQKQNIFYIVEKEIAEFALKAGRSTSDLLYPVEYIKTDGAYFIKELGLL